MLHALNSLISFVLNWSKFKNDFFCYT